MADHKALYQEVILDHNRKPRNFGTLENPSHHADGHNPLCGDHITVALELADGRIDRIAFQGESCAICKASASMMTVAVKGKALDEAQTLIRAFLDMATGKLDLDAPNQDRASRRICRRAQSADAGQVRHPALAHAAGRLQCPAQRIHRGGR
jgi:nitrogen fixation NifU-like protein